LVNNSEGDCDALNQHMRAAIGRSALLNAGQEISLARLVQSGCRATDVWILPSADPEASGGSSTLTGISRTVTGRAEALKDQ